jgi:hypothetical protein
MLPTRPGVPDPPRRPPPQKKQLYARLAQDWALPPLNSTGVSHRYLQQVEAGTVFRVGVLELKRFLAECRPGQLQKVAFANKDQAYAKVNRLLREMGRPALGFEERCWPDGEWLYRVARFVDPGNVCGLFVEAVGDLPDSQADSVRIELGKRRIEEELSTELGWRDRPEVAQAIHELRLSQQRWTSRRTELSGLLLLGQKLEVQVRQDEETVERRLQQAVQVALERVRTRTAPDGVEQYLAREREVSRK